MEQSACGRNAALFTAGSLRFLSLSQKVEQQRLNSKVHHLCTQSLVATISAHNRLLQPSRRTIACCNHLCIQSLVATNTFSLLLQTFTKEGNVVLS